MPKNNVEEISSVTGAAEVVELLPEEIVVNEELNVRPWEGDPEAEQERIERLARTIEQEGQLMDGLVQAVEANGVVEYQLIAGNRRRNAIALINAGKSDAEQPMKMRVRVLRNQSKEQAFRKAIIENLHRKDFSAMDLAMDIQRVREMNGWQAGKFTKKVAEYFGVSPAQITQHEKLLSLPADVQIKVHEGMLSAQSAFDLVDVRPEKRGEVLAKAEEKRQEEEARKSEAAGSAGSAGSAKKGKAGAGADAGVGNGSAEATAETEEEGRGKLKRKHVLAATREVEGATDKPKPRTRNEIVAFFREVADSPAYGYANSPVRAFATFFCDKWAPAVGAGKSDRSLTTRFDAMVFSGEGDLLTGEGTPNKEEQKLIEQEEAERKEREKQEKAEQKAAKKKAKST